MTALHTTLNEMSLDEARAALTRCCGAHRWVQGMLDARPFTSKDGVFVQASRVWKDLGREDYLEAFSHHPKIGANVESLREKFNSTAQWSSQEQASVQQASEETIQALARGNRLYEERYGYIFIVCATGKSASEMLTLLEARLDNEAAQELQHAADEQEKITAIRLEKLAS